MEKNLRLRPTEAARRRKHIRKRSLTATLGGFILLLAIVGAAVCLFLVISWGVRTVRNYFSPTETPRYFSTYLNPVVGLDPSPVGSPDEINPDWELKAALFATAVQGKNTGNYGVTDNQREIVPVSDIITTYEKYFGDKTAPSLHTLTENGVSYEYDDKRKCFYMPMNAINYAYSAKVTKISRVSGGVKLTVEYLPSTGINQQATGTAPIKTLTYVLHGRNGNYTLYEIDAPKGSSSSSRLVLPPSSSSADESSSSGSSSTSSGSSSGGTSSSGN